MGSQRVTHDCATNFQLSFSTAGLPGNSYSPFKLLQVFLRREILNTPRKTAISLSPSHLCRDNICILIWLKEMGMPDHLTCLLRNLYAGQEATVRTGHGTTDWFQIGKGVYQGCILSPCVFNLYAEYTMRNAGLEEAQAGIKIAGRNINHLRYAHDTTLMAESEEELKSLLMKVKEKSEEVG